mmetsp:Transcript_4854/g.9077  ORF Transcript_4854/g.9077 Transcript_4854/m.9077 type:complete len:97 (-) Transcript_4854:750-1040(-)
MAAQPRRGIKWDEATIAEHDTERGTRQKITEAKTPYNYYEGSDEEPAPEVDLYSVSEQLEAQAKKEEFERKRKEHYNEIYTLRAMRHRESDSDEEA